MFKAGDLLYNKEWPHVVFLLVEMGDVQEDGRTHVLVRLFTNGETPKLCSLQPEAYWKSIKDIEEKERRFMRIGHLNLSFLKDKLPK